MINIDSHSFNSVRRGFSLSSLLVSPSSSKINTSTDFTVYRLDMEQLTDGDTQARNSLTRILERIVSGQDEVFTSPIANNALPDEILSSWDRIFEANVSKCNSVLNRIEMSNRSKFGPRSIAKPWLERKEKIYSSFGEGNRLPQIKVPKLGDAWRLRPLTREAAAKYLKRSTNSGLPCLVRKGNIIAETIKDLDSLLFKYPAVLFTRTQEGGKTRDVWGYPIADTLFEMQYYRPILQHQIRQPWRAALRSPASLDEAINKLMNQNKERGKYMVSGDVSSFDDDAKYALQKVAFDAFKDLYQQQYHDDIDSLFERFNTIPIVTPDGVLSGAHGIPSGSGFTNEAGSTIQFSIIESGCYDTVSLDTIQLQGDDSACSSSNPERLFQAYIDAGLKINPDKSDISEKYCTYLQFLYHPDFRSTDGIVRGVYPTYRALNRIIHMERFDDISKEDISGKDYFAIRTISILENCKHHPLFKDLVKFVWSFDKYKLKTSDLGIRQYVSLKRIQEGKDIKFTNYTYGDDVEGIRNFETFKYIKELNG